MHATSRAASADASGGVVDVERHTLICQCVSSVERHTLNWQCASSVDVERTTSHRMRTDEGTMPSTSFSVHYCKIQ